MLDDQLEFCQSTRPPTPNVRCGREAPLNGFELRGWGILDLFLFSPPNHTTLLPNRAASPVRSIDLLGNPYQFGGASRASSIESSNSTCRTRSAWPRPSILGGTSPWQTLFLRFQPL